MASNNNANVSGSIRTRPCPVCGNLESKKLFEQRFEQLSAVSFLSGYDVVVCRRCGAGFADGIPPQDVFDSYYRDLSKYEYEYRGGKESVADEGRFREIASTLIQAIPSRNARILELGCATGGLLANLRDAGFRQVQGLDPSPGCARAAWELYKIPVFANSLFQVPAEPGSYDFIILVGVLEHIEDIRLALSKLRDLLSHEGRVYAEVPDGSRLAGRPDAPFQEFSTEHINFFSTTSLSNVFELNGFRTVDIGRAVRQQNENTTCPAAYGVYQRADNYEGSLKHDHETEQGLLRYIEESASVDSTIREIIRSRAKGRKILVWGTGSHTQRLIAAGAFDDVMIKAFVDSNPKYQGQELHGLPVLQPREIAARTEPILISSRGYQREIHDQIRSHLKLSNEVILLYE
jgi:2-polyprenyl-3-methyl-5-hydroxy-6-metoxy-1,4-benzoquinol methylase